MRVLAVDFGRRRTGLALSDPVGITCRPLEVLVEQDQSRLARLIAAVAQENEVERVVLGLPRPLRGGRNQQMDEVIGFKSVLDRHVGVPVVLWDERFTSKLAQRRREVGKHQDAVAACYLLQNYLDAQSPDRERSR